MTLRAAPRREPPFDDEPSGPPGPPGPPARRLSLVTAGLGVQQLPFTLASTLPARLGRHRSWAAPVPTDRGDLPDPAAWSRRVLVALLEARAGLRPLRQLVGYFSPPALSWVETNFGRLPTGASRHQHVSVNSVHVCEPANGIAEVCAIVFTGARYRAIATRLEGLDGHWRCVHLEVG
jgi:hypothetical protein